MFDTLSGFWEDIKATGTGFIESVKDGDPLPANVSQYWTGKTLTENVESIKDNIESGLLKYGSIILLIIIVGFFIYSYTKKKAESLV